MKTATIVLGFFILIMTMMAGSYVATKWIIRDVVVHAVKKECLIGNPIQKQVHETGSKETKKEKTK